MTTNKYGMRVFEAMYYDECAEDCGTRIVPGDSITISGDERTHERCAIRAMESRDADDGATLGAVVCMKCFQQKSIAGTCGCDA